MTTIKLAIDWTPNVNHIGFYLAKELGHYEREGIYLEILNPAEDNYQMTPGKKLELGRADFAIAPFETVISLNNKANKVDAVAVYAVLQEDLSRIVSLEGANIRSPKELDGKIYASYKARYEDHIVRQMIINDGGRGETEIIYPDKLGIWNTLLEGKADSTWIFDNWEGTEAESKNVKLSKFKMSDFGIPYGYSPVALAKRSEIASRKDLFSRFIKATREGFLHAADHPDESVKILRGHLSAYDRKNIDLAKSLEVSAPHFGDEAHCGKMKPEKVAAFLEWIVEKGLEDKVILDQPLFTNELFG